ncbi:MAG: hypothetical protein D6689_16410 [Deltaproteobacteria bacterium]|nr:MAG: hypothetical protein D6689_16410 [Deltaproteobacteria bacterium]
MVIALAAAVAAASAPPRAAAYDNHFTHRWITRQAAALLAAAYPGRYDELVAYVDAVAAGADHEDDLILDGDDDPTTLRVMRHFFRPTDGAGLFMNGRQFPNSYEWAIVPSDENAWDWSDGIAAYARGDVEEAYFVLGHVVHLIQDATVPAHTHLDVHGPPNGDDYEAWCTAQMTDEFTSALPLPPPGAAIPEFADPLDAWMATASASYWRALYPGTLVGTERAEGVLADMFPSIRWSWLSEQWTISEPPVGALDEDFFEHEPGYFYFKNAEYAARVDRAAFDPRDPRAARFEPNAAGAPMTELLARDLVPVAILHSAGVMKLYLDEAYAAAPDGEPPPDPTPAPAASGCRAAGTGSAGAAWLAVLLAVIRRRTRCARV